MPTITRETIAGLTEPGRIYWDSELRGFGYRVRLCADGKIRASFIVQYRFGGGQRRQKIGDANRLNADQARKRAREMLAQVTLGIDPAAQKATERASSALTFAKAVEQYLNLKKAEVRPSSLRLTALYLTAKQYFGALHAMPLAKITRSEVSTALNKITLASGAPSASQARAHLSAFFTWSMRQGHVEQNPVIATVSPKAGPGRDRVLSDEELGTIWRACGEDDYGKITRLLILTGARRSEIGGLKWSEIDLDAGTITLPKERTKNGREHTLPITEMMREVLDDVPRRINRDCLFGDRADRGFASWQYAKANFGDGIATEWRLHDLRRTVVTRMSDLGVQPHVVEQVVNHVGVARSGVAGVYNKSAYSREVKVAFVLWSDHISSIVDGGEHKLLAFAKTA
jgi:integrase